MGARLEAWGSDALHLLVAIAPVRLRERETKKRLRPRGRHPGANNRGREERVE